MSHRDYYHKPFSAAELARLLDQLQQKMPDVMLGRSREGTGNLCVYNHDEYVGVIELHDPPELMLLDEEDV